MLNWNDIILSLLGKANGKGKQLYIEIMNPDHTSEKIYFDKVDENAEAIIVKFTRKN